MIKFPKGADWEHMDDNKLDKVINELVEHIESALSVDSDYVDCVRTDLLQTVVGLLKEQETEIYKLQKELNYWQYTGIKKGW